MLHLTKLFSKKFVKDKNYRNVRDHCHFTGKYRGTVHSICNVRCNIPKEIPAVFHNGSNYDYQFIMKELANEFKKPFECLGKYTEEYKTFSVSIEKEATKIYEDGNESIVTISYKVKFIDSAKVLKNAFNFSDNDINKIILLLKKYIFIFMSI